MKGNFAGVIINRLALNIDKIFDYKIPDDLIDKICVGSHVFVPFGRGKKLIDGYVLYIKDETDFEGDVKEIASLASSVNSIMSSANSDILNSFPIGITFISFSSLIAIAMTAETMLDKSGESGDPYLVHDLRGNAFSFSPLIMMLAVGLSHMAFIMLR